MAELPAQIYDYWPRYVRFPLMGLERKYIQVFNSISRDIRNGLNKWFPWSKTPEKVRKKSTEFTKNISFTIKIFSYHEPSKFL